MSELARENAELKAIIVQLKSQIPPLDGRSRGRIGETNMRDLLEDSLTSRDGYKIKPVNGLAHHTDIIVQKEGANDICIEVKSHAGSVRNEEVDKFLFDIIGLNVSGIFVSIDSKIVGKSNISVNNLGNGHFAVFLANNKLDASIVKEFVLLIHSLESNMNYNHTSLGPTDILQLHLYAKNWENLMGLITANMKHTMGMMNLFDFEKLKNITYVSHDDPASGSGERSAVVDQSDVQVKPMYKCKFCVKTYPYKSSTSRHEVKCTFRPRT